MKTYHIKTQLSYIAAPGTPTRPKTGKEMEDFARSGKDLWCYGSPSIPAGRCSIRDVEPGTKMELLYGTFNNKLKVIVA